MQIRKKEHKQMFTIQDKKAEYLNVIFENQNMIRGKQPILKVVYWIWINHLWTFLSAALFSNLSHLIQTLQIPKAICIGVTFVDSHFEHVIQSCMNKKCLVIISDCFRKINNWTSFLSFSMCVCLLFFDHSFDFYKLKHLCRFLLPANEDNVGFKLIDVIEIKSKEKMLTRLCIHDRSRFMYSTQETFTKLFILITC